ncbi:hypothetical protein [Brevundimonas sp. FT23042]|uniref:hypothetical protein n=1 Tax=Brevundimonas sp. FT23042 TaxID=3393749 RepID=UPI003B588B1F
MSEAEMKRSAWLGVLGIALLVSGFYAGALFPDLGLIVLLPVGLGFWLAGSTGRNANPIRWKMHARTKAGGLRSYPAPDWLYWSMVPVLAFFVGVPLFGGLVFGRIGLHAVLTLSVCWGLALLLIGAAFVLLLQEIRLLYANIALLDESEGAA